MFVGPVRLSLLAGVMAFGAIGATLALMGLGVPLLVAAVVSAALAGLVQWMTLRAQPLAGPLAEPLGGSEAAGLREQLQAYRTHTAALRHDLRGVLSPALMMSDRLINHADPAVQRAGTAVVRSIDRATTLLTDSRALMALDAEGASSAGGASGMPPAGR